MSLLFILHSDPAIKLFCSVKNACLAARIPAIVTANAAFHAGGVVRIFIGVPLSPVHAGQGR